METPLFSDEIFKQNVEDTVEDADLLNDETFGLCDDIGELNGDWEKRHEELSKVLELEHGRRTFDSLPGKFCADLNISFDSHQESHVITSDDEEDDIIENTISQLGLDDDFQFVVKSNAKSPSIEFKESQQSWTSPSRGQEHLSDSLKELISPGEGVWASPSREHSLSDYLSPSARMKDADEAILKQLLFGREDKFSCTDVPPLPPFNENDVSPLGAFNSNDVSLLSSFERNTASPFSRNESPLPPLNSNDMSTLSAFSSSDMSPLTTVNNDDVSALPVFRSTDISTLPAFGSGNVTPLPAFKSDDVSKNVIRVEDLERGLTSVTSGIESDENQWSELSKIKKHVYDRASGSPSTNGSNLPSTPYPHSKRDGMHHDSRISNASPSPYEMNRIASMVMMNQQLMGLRGYSPMMNMTFPPIIRPTLLPDPLLFSNPNRCNPKWQQRVPGKYQGRQSFGSQDRYSKDDCHWSKGWQNPNPNEIDYDQFIQLGPSKMMNSKEKKWIFKISLMSLLSGDPANSDYYFRSFLAKKYNNEKEKEVDKEVQKTLDTSNQLMIYAQRQQQTKESHKPVKFKGSLGKLSITSVHHPRQLMDFTSLEQEPKVSDSVGKKKFLLYGTVEKMYSILLQILDMDREFINNSSEEQEEFLYSRSRKINELFDLFRIDIQDSQNSSDATHFGNLMSISKGRKLLTRILMLFSQEQSEMMLVAVINILPALLKKDKEQSLVSFAEKLQILLSRSQQKFRLKCIQLIRKIDLNVLLTHPTSILLLSGLLNSWEEKNPNNSLEWSYYSEEVSKILARLPGDILTKNKANLEHLKSILCVEERLIDA